MSGGPARLSIAFQPQAQRTEYEHIGDEKRLQSSLIPRSWERLWLSDDDTDASVCNIRRNEMGLDRTSERHLEHFARLCLVFSFQA